MLVPLAFTVFRFAEVLEDVVALGLLAVDAEDLTLGLQDPGQQEAEVLDAGPRREEEHRLLLVLSQELDEAGKLFGRLADHEVVVERNRRCVFRRGGT